MIATACKQQLGVVGRANVKQHILGMDFLNKYKLNLEWDDIDQSDLFIVDRKAQIRSKLQVITVPTDKPRLHYLSQADDAGPLEVVPGG